MELTEYEKFWDHMSRSEEVDYADAGDLALFGHVHGLLFFDDGIV